jgi:hypothetical protein
MMRKLVFAVAAFLCFPLIADAKSAKLTAADTVATLDFPDSWKISNIKRGIETKSPDEEVYVWAESSLQTKWTPYRRSTTNISRSRR